MKSFLDDLSKIARPAGRGDYVFSAVNGESPGHVQIIHGRGRRIEIHRLYAKQPGRGNGSAMLKALCALADRHSVTLTLKVLPIGRKPHPMTADQLFAWYQRRGFEGTKRRMVRTPRIVE